MNTVHLHGSLKETFGGPFDLEIRDAKEAIRALGCQLEGFVAAIQNGEWRVIRGPEDTGQSLDEDTLGLGLGDQPLHIIPVAQGAKSGGVGKIIVGVAMVGAAFFTAGGSLAAMSALEVGVAAMGAGMVIAGASSMLAPTPETGSYESKNKDEQSFLFNGPVNVNKQGVAVPLIYGEVITGSVVISAGIRAQDIPVNTPAGGPTGSSGLLEGK